MANADDREKVLNDLGYLVVRSGRLVFCARHTILSDFAADLCRVLPSDHKYEATVFVGVHLFWDLPDIEGVTLGIQTEHLFDWNGDPWWSSAYPEQRIRRHLGYLNGLLDLSFSSTAAYKILRHDRQRKVLFGPYVFPEHSPQFLPQGQEIAFIGKYAGRRREVIAGLSLPDPVNIISPRTFGNELAIVLENSSGVLNVHSAEGVYTEVPRLLKAYLAGKALYSEELDYPFVEGRHYISLSESDPITKPVDVFTRFAREVASAYTFETFLRRFTAP